jgi:hypothetical protein
VPAATESFGLFFHTFFPDTTMSRTYDLYVNLLSARPVPEESRQKWKNILSFAVDDPESVIEQGINPDIVIENSGIEVLNLSDGRTEFSLRLDKQIGGGYGLDAYLIDLKKAIYKALKPLKKRYKLSYSATDLDRDPDESGSVSSSELAAEYGLTA